MESLVVHRVTGGSGRRGRCGVGLAVLLALVFACPVHAQEPQGTNVQVDVNYVYAAQLGFGTYSVGGLDVNVYSVPIEFSLGEVLLDWRLRIALPVLYGDFDFKGTVTTDEGERVRVRADQKILATEPKLRLEIPILEPWTLSLIGAWGFGYAFDFDGDARLVNASGQAQGPREKFDQSSYWYYTYQAGVSSLLQQNVDRWTFSLGNAFIYAGTADLLDDSNVQGYGAIETGVDARHPLGFRIEGYEPDASLFFIWYYFTPSLEFTRVEEKSLEVDNVFEIGLTLGADRATPFEIPLLGNPRIGVSYRVGNDLDAVRVNFGFPF